MYRDKVNNNIIKSVYDNVLHGIIRIDISVYASGGVNRADRWRVRS